jgi:hypothetical protein
MTTTDGRETAEIELMGDNRVSKTTSRAVAAVRFRRSDMPGNLPLKRRSVGHCTAKIIDV